MEEVSDRMNFIDENLHKRDDSIHQLKLDVIALQEKKLDAIDFNKYKDTRLEKFIYTSQDELSDLHNKVLTMENYLERYIPI